MYTSIVISSAVRRFVRCHNKDIESVTSQPLMDRSLQHIVWTYGGVEILPFNIFFRLSILALVAKI